MKQLFLSVCEWLENRNVEPENFYKFEVRGSESPYEVRLQGHFRTDLVKKLKDDCLFTIDSNGYLESSISYYIGPGESLNINIVLT